jgi:uncharacterized protein (DUF934 family)
MPDYVVDGRVCNDPWYTPAGTASKVAPSWETYAATSLRAVRLSADDDPERWPEFWGNLAMIDLVVDDFNDGRTFSLARKLRAAGFKGELRVSGAFLLDQVQYFARCGCNAFSPKENALLSKISHQLGIFTVSYQPLWSRENEHLLASR